MPKVDLPPKGTFEDAFLFSRVVGCVGSLEGIGQFKMDGVFCDIEIS